MKRKIYRFLAAMLAVLSAVVVTACGGGSGSASTGSSTVLDGLASKGPIANGTVSVYAIENGQKGMLLFTTTTGPDGAFKADLGSYSGPVMVEVTGGSYTDEATGKTMQVGATVFRTAMSNASGTMTVAVTPITEMAVQAMGAAMTPDAISAANSMMASKFGMQDIVNTLPHDVSTPAQPGQDAQTYYGLMLAAMSQASSTGNTSIPTMMNTIANGVKDSASTGTPDPAGTANIQAMNSMITTMSQGFVDFSSSNANNMTGVKTMSPGGMMSGK